MSRRIPFFRAGTPAVPSKVEDEPARDGEIFSSDGVHFPTLHDLPRGRRPSPLP